MITNQEKTFRPFFDRINYFYKPGQDSYEKLKTDCSTKVVDLELVQGLEGNVLKRKALKQRILVVIDDLYDEAARTKEFLDLVISGRH